MTLPTHFHVALDAEIFLGEALDFDSVKLTVLLSHVRAKRVSLYLTDVHRREISQRIRVSVGEARAALKRSDFRTSVKVLRHVENYKNVFENVDHEAVAAIL